MNNIYYRTFEKLEEDIFVPTPDKGNGTGEEQVDISKDLKTATEGFDIYKNSQSENKDAEALVKIYKSFQDGKMDGNQTDFLVEKNSQYWNNYNKLKGNYKFSSQILALRKSCPSLIRNNLDMSASEKGAKYVATRLAELQYFGLDGKKINPDTITGRNDKNLLFATYIFQRCCSTYADKARQTYKKVKKSDYMIDGIIGPAGMLSLADNKNVCLFDEMQMKRIKPYYTNESVNLINLRSDVESKTIRIEASETSEKTYKQLSLIDKGKTVDLTINDKPPFEAKDANRHKALGYTQDTANKNKFTKTEIEGNYTITYDPNAKDEKTARIFNFTAVEKKEDTPETVDLTNDLAEIDKSVSTIFDDKKKSALVTWEGSKAKFKNKGTTYELAYDSTKGIYNLTTTDGASKFNKDSATSYSLEGKAIDKTKVDEAVQTSVKIYKTILSEVAASFKAPEKPIYTVESYNQEFDKLELDWKQILAQNNREELSKIQPDQVAKQDKKVIDETKQKITAVIQKLIPLRNKAIELKDKYNQFSINKDAKDANKLQEAMDKNIQFLESLPGLIDDKAQLETLVKKYDQLIKEGDEALGLYKSNRVKNAGKLDEAEGKYKDAQKLEAQVNKANTKTKLQEITTIKQGLENEKANALNQYNQDYKGVESGYKAKTFDIVSGLPDEVNANSLKLLETAMQVVSDYEAYIKEYEGKISGLQKSYEALGDNKGASNPLVLTKMISTDKEAVARRKQAIIEGRDKINKEVYSKISENIGFGGIWNTQKIVTGSAINIGDILIPNDSSDGFTISNSVENLEIDSPELVGSIPLFGEITATLTKNIIHLTYKKSENLLTFK